MKGVLIFAMVRSGGSYLSQVLSGGMPILSEPVLPDDGFQSSETDNVARLLRFQEEASKYQVVKLCGFAHYLDRLKDRRLTLPAGLRPVCLFRDPITQTASHLFTFCDWADNWAPREHFWDAIRAYRQHFELCQDIRRQWPETLFLRYEDTIGEGLIPTLAAVYGEEHRAFAAYAQEAQVYHYRLGPTTDGSAWAPSRYSLTNKEKAWVRERLGDVMEAIGYGR